MPFFFCSGAHRAQSREAPGASANAVDQDGRVARAALRRGTPASCGRGMGKLCHVSGPKKSQRTLTVFASRPTYSNSPETTAMGPAAVSVPRNLSVRRDSALQRSDRAMAQDVCVWAVRPEPEGETRARLQRADVTTVSSYEEPRPLVDALGRLSEAARSSPRVPDWVWEHRP